MEMPLVVFGVFSVVFGALLLAGLTGLPLLAAVLLIIPGCIAEPAYYAFLDHYKIRYFPVMYFFVILIILLM